MELNHRLVDIDEPTPELTNIGFSLDRLLSWAAKQGYSDCIITSEQPLMFRKNRETFVSSNGPLAEPLVNAIARYVASDGHIINVLSGSPLDIQYSTGTLNNKNSRRRFRVNITAVYNARALNAISLVFRAIDTAPWQIKALNVDENLLSNFRSEQGLHLISGPMGGGKTTLAAAVIADINKTSQKFIITYEDPIEYEFTSDDSNSVYVSQTEIGRGVKSFDQALVNATRRSADIYFWGEVRDRGSIRALSVACDLGAAVFSTVHANASANVISRLIRQFPDDQRDGLQAALVSNLRTLCHQRLVLSTENKLIPLREWLSITESIKLELLECTLDQIQPTIKKHQRTSKTDLQSSLDQLLANEQISKATYQKLTCEHIYHE